MILGSSRDGVFVLLTKSDYVTKSKVSAVIHQNMEVVHSNLGMNSPKGTRKMHEKSSQL